MAPSSPSKRPLQVQHPAPVQGRRRPAHRTATALRSWRTTPCGPQLQPPLQGLVRAASRAATAHLRPAACFSRSAWAVGLVVRTIFCLPARRDSNSFIRLRQRSAASLDQHHDVLQIGRLEPDRAVRARGRAAAAARRRQSLGPAWRADVELPAAVHADRPRGRNRQPQGRIEQVELALDQHGHAPGLQIDQGDRRGIAAGVLLFRGRLSGAAPCRRPARPHRALAAAPRA